MEGKQLAQIFKGEFITTYNYEKCDRAKNFGTATGKAIQVETSPYAVIDFDINADEIKKSLGQKITINFKNKAKIVETYSGGFHIYVKDDGIWNDLDKNRICGIYHSETAHMTGDGLKNDYAIDVMLSHHHDKRNLVVLPTSLVKTKKSNNEIREYKLIYDCEDDKLIGFSEALSLLDSRMNIKINKPSNEKKKDSFNNLIKEIEKGVQIADDKKEKEYKQATIGKELFDTIVKGFEGVEIHGESQDIEREIGVLQIITALNACENDEISKDDIEKAFDFIERNGNLTSKAQERFGEICYRNRNIKADTWQQLFKMIRIHNKTYFNKNIVPLIDPKKQFIEGNYTFDTYLMNYHKFTTKYQHINALAKCIAYNTKGGYIKKTTDNEGNIVYEVIKSDAELKCLCNRNFDIKASEAEIEKMREQKKKIVEVKSYNIVKFLKEADVSAKLNTFEGIALSPQNEKTLWQYRSPNGKTYNKKLIEAWIEFMKSRIVNERPFMEELYSHAYRLRNPSAFIEKFFIHFGSPNTGKSFLAACLANVYPSLANVAVNPNQTNDLFNSWLSTLLMVHMEEADTYNYRNKDFEQFVKRITTINGSARAMYRETKAVRNSAIVGMNTNDPNLYGLTRSDEATKTRLVIIEFKDNNLTPQEWANVREKYIDNADFAYSLYTYLSEELEIPSTFSISRYNGEEKYDFINKACANNKNSLELWFESIVEDARFASYEDCKNGLLL